MYKGVIFDMDGVLADTEDFYNKRRDQYLKAMGYYEEDSGYDFTGSNEKALWEILVPQDQELRNEMMIGYRAYQKLHPVPFDTLSNPDAKPLFTELKKRGFKIGIASSSDMKSIKLLAETAGISGLVDYELSGENCSAHKPSPEIYLRVLESLQLSAEQVLVVEDSPTGILSAKRADLRVLALRPGNGKILDQSGADVIIDRLLDVLEYVS